jgi:hypothetical protein
VSKTQRGKDRGGVAANYGGVVRPRRRRDPRALAALERFAATDGRRLAELERDRERLLRKRDRAILRALDAGLPQRVVAEIVGVSPGRVAQLARRRD